MEYFYPRPPRGGRPADAVKYVGGIIFLSTPSARRATRVRIVVIDDLGFLSTPSARRATLVIPAHTAAAWNFYPRPPRGGRRSTTAWICPVWNFYPRPPRGGRHAKSAADYMAKWISIHALREEGDSLLHQGSSLVAEFLSTPSARRATSAAVEMFFSMIFLSTPYARRATAKTETKSLFSNKLYNILHEFRRALIYNGSKSYPNHAK